jgi:hypothetical protein
LPNRVTAACWRSILRWSREQRAAFAHDDRRDRDVELVEQTRLEQVRVKRVLFWILERAWKVNCVETSAVGRVVRVTETGSLAGTWSGATWTGSTR